MARDARRPKGIDTGTDGSLERTADTFIDATGASHLVAVPTAAGPPVPYWPSVVVKPDTVRGVGTYYVNLILDVFFGVFALVIGLSAIFVSVASDPIGTITVFAALGSATCGLIIVFIINFIISLMSVFRMHHGANEYGPEHARNERRGWMFKWIGTSLSTLAAILVVYLVGLAAGPLFFGTSIPPTLFVPLLITGFWTAGVTAKGQMYRFMVRSLQTPESRRWSDVASAVIPILGIGGLALVGYSTLRVIDLLSDPGTVTSQEVGRFSQIMVGGVFLPPGFALVGYVIFLTVYGKTRDRLSQGLAHLYAAVPPPAMWTGYNPAPPSRPASPPITESNPGPRGGGFCGQCGQAFQEADLFCSNCGRPR
jgi:hypothetical protein